MIPVDRKYCLIASKLSEGKKTMSEQTTSRKTARLHTLPSNSASCRTHITVAKMTFSRESTKVSRQPSKHPAKKLPFCRVCQKQSACGVQCFTERPLNPCPPLLDAECTFRVHHIRNASPYFSKSQLQTFHFLSTHSFVRLSFPIISSMPARVFISRPPRSVPCNFFPHTANSHG